MQQINFIGRLESNKGATMLFIIEKTKEATFNFSQNAINIIRNGNTIDYKFSKWF